MTNVGQEMQGNEFRHGGGAEQPWEMQTDLQNLIIYRMAC